MRHIPLVVLLAAGSLTLVAGGCKTAGSMLANTQKPSLKVLGASIDSITTDSAGLVFDVEVGNPYDLPLPLANVDYALASRGTSFLSGTADVQGVIPAGATRAFKVPATVTFAELLTALKGVTPGQVVPYQADLNFNVDAPAVGRLSVPVKRAGELPVPAAPEVSVQDVKWQDMGLTNASGVVKLKVTNTNQFAVDLRNLGFNLDLGGKKIANGTIAKGIHFKGGDTATIDVPVSFSILNAGLGAFSALSDKADKYKVNGVAEFGTPFGPAKLAY